MSFILRGTSILRPPSLLPLTDEPLLATITSGPFSAETEVCGWLSIESCSRARSIEKRIFRWFAHNEVNASMGRNRDVDQIR